MGKEWYEGKITKGHGETFEDDGYVQYHDCGDGLMDVCLYVYFIF